MPSPNTKKLKMLILTNRTYLTEWIIILTKMGKGKVMINNDHYHGHYEGGGGGTEEWE